MTLATPSGSRARNGCSFAVKGRLQRSQAPLTRPALHAQPLVSIQMGCYTGTGLLLLRTGAMGWVLKAGGASQQHARQLPSLASNLRTTHIHKISELACRSGYGCKGPVVGQLWLWHVGCGTCGKHGAPDAP